MARPKSEPDIPVEPHVFSDAELASLSVTHGKRPNIPPAELRRLADGRKQLLGARLKAVSDGSERVDEDMVEQYRFELKMMLAGNWYPGVLKPQGKDAKLVEAVMGVPGAARSPQSAVVEQRVDAMLES